MSGILERLGNFFTNFHQRYEEYKRPRIPVNLLRSKDTILIKPEPAIKSKLPDASTPKPVVNLEENIIGEYFRP